MLLDCPMNYLKCITLPATLTAWYELLIKVIVKNFSDEYLNKTTPDTPKYYNYDML